MAQKKRLGIGPRLSKIKPNPRKFSEEEQELRDLWNRQEFESPKSMWSLSKNPSLPKHPPLFRSEPTIVGPELARAAEKFYRIAPNLRGKSPHIQFGPSKEIIEKMLDSGFSPDEFEHSGYHGVTDADTKEIGVNPSIGLKYPNLPGKFPEMRTEWHKGIMSEEVLGHELTHAAGHNAEYHPMEAVRLIRKMKLRE